MVSGRPGGNVGAHVHPRQTSSIDHWWDPGAPGISSSADWTPWSDTQNCGGDDSRCWIVRRVLNGTEIIKISLDLGVTNHAPWVLSRSSSPPVAAYASVLLQRRCALTPASQILLHIPIGAPFWPPPCQYVPRPEHMGSPRTASKVYGGPLACLLIGGIHRYQGTLSPPKARKVFEGNVEPGPL